jgi:hypothetical protein
MDKNQEMQAIESRLDDLAGMSLSDGAYARDAFTYAMVTVTHINQFMAQARAQTLVGGGALGEDLLSAFRTWLDHLVTALTEIVENLPNASSFSISVGGNVSVSVNFTGAPSGLAG